MRTLFILGLATTIACGGPLLVYETDGAAGGVPFYVMEQYDSSSSTYEESFVQMQVTASKDKFSAQMTVYVRDPAIVNEIYLNYLSASDSAKAWEATAVKAMSEIKNHNVNFSLIPFGQITSPNQFVKPTVALVAHSLGRIQVPSTEMHRFNIRVPRGGTASGEVDLNTDGTISKGIAAKTDTLPNTIVTAAGTTIGALLGAGVPNTIVAHYFPTTTAPSTKTAFFLNLKPDFDVQLAVTQVRRDYIVTLAAKAGTKGCQGWTSSDSFASTDNCRASVSVTTSTDAPKADSSAVNFSGAVMLPKPGK